MNEKYIWQQVDYENPLFWDCFLPCFSDSRSKRIWCVFHENNLLTRSWDVGFAAFDAKIKNVKDGFTDEDVWDGNYYIATITKDSVFFHTCFPEEDDRGYELGIEETLKLIRECRVINYTGNETRACKRKKADRVKIVVAAFDEQGQIHEDYVFTDPLIISKDNFVVGQNLCLKDALYLKIGETRKIWNNPFGNHVPERVKVVDLTELPQDMELKVGMSVALAVPDVGNAIGKVLEINDKTAKVDFNHPRAGEIVYCTVTRIG